MPNGRTQSSIGTPKPSRFSIGATALLVAGACAGADARAEFAYEEITDKLTDKATMQATSSVVVNGTRFDVALECAAVSNWPQSHALVPGIAVWIATFDAKSGDGKAISAEGRALIKTSKGLGVHSGRALAVRIDKTPAFEVAGALVQYSNRIEFWLDEKQKALLLASSVLLIKGVIGEDLIELPTSLAAKFRDHPTCRAGTADKRSASTPPSEPSQRKPRFGDLNGKQCLNYPEDESWQVRAQYWSCSGAPPSEAGLTCRNFAETITLKDGSTHTERGRRCTNARGETVILPPR